MGWLRRFAEWWRREAAKAEREIAKRRAQRQDPGLNIDSGYRYDSNSGRVVFETRVRRED
jgi:uncharacterized phage protein gp47/JayE